MRNRHIFLLIVAVVFFIEIPDSRADSVLQISSHDDFVHLVAHVGLSYTINTITYGVLHKTLGIDTDRSLVVSILTTLAVGAAYKIVENASPAEYEKSMFRNSIGTLASVGSILVFKF